jgi:hypothetical protein
MNPYYGKTANFDANTDLSFLPKAKGAPVMLLLPTVLLTLKMILVIMPAALRATD